MKNTTQINHTELLSTIYHTDPLLRKHGLLVSQEGFGPLAKFDVVTADTYMFVSGERLAAYEAESSQPCF